MLKMSQCLDGYYLLWFIYTQRPSRLVGICFGVCYQKPRAQVYFDCLGCQAASGEHARARCYGICNQQKAAARAHGIPCPKNQAPWSGSHIKQQEGLCPLWVSLERINQHLSFIMMIWVLFLVRTFISTALNPACGCTQMFYLT